MKADEAALLVPDDCVGAAVEPPAFSPHANAPVRLFAIEKVRLVDRADVARSLGTHEQTRSDQMVQLDR